MAALMSAGKVRVFDGCSPMMEVIFHQVDRHRQGEWAAMKNTWVFGKKMKVV